MFTIPSIALDAKYTLKQYLLNEVESRELGLAKWCYTSHFSVLISLEIQVRQCMHKFLYTGLCYVIIIVFTNTINKNSSLLK